MSKRKTKAQREAEKREALRQRVADIVSGACGRDMDTEDEWVSVEELPRVLASVRERLSIPRKALIFSTWSLDK